MHRAVLNLIAVAERSDHGYSDVPPGSMNDEIESELADTRSHAAIDCGSVDTESTRLNQFCSGTTGHMCPHRTSRA